MYQKILVPVDLGDKHSWRKAIPTAVALCESFDAGLLVMTVIPDIAMPVIGQYLPQDFSARVKQQVHGQLGAFVQSQVPPGIEVQRRVAIGKIHREIVQVAAEAEVDLIVMGCHRLDLQDDSLGPHAASVVRHAINSVMIVRD